jgi:hypothetical protein
MATPEELQQDKDFLMASPGDQAAYLSDTDPDFKAASPAEQTQYLAHVMGNASQSAMPKPDLQMETSAIGHLAPRPVPQTKAAGAIQGDLPGYEGSMASGDEDKGAFMTSAGVAGALPLMGAGALRMLGPIMARHPLITSILAGEAIHGARQIPYVGRFVPPYAEMLPLLLGGGKGARAAEAEGAAAAKTPIYRDATVNRRNIPEFAGETIAAPKTAPIYRDATVNRRNIPDYAGEEGAIGRIETQAPAPPVSTPISRTSHRADLMEDKGIQELQQDQLEGAGIQARKAYADEAEQYRYKVAREARRGRGSKISTPIEQAQSPEDMTEILQKSLEEARKKRPRK